MNGFFDALIVTVAGMGIVFVVLIVISFIISGFKYINVLEKRRDDKLAKKSEPKEKQVPVQVVENVVQDDLELVAVITSVIASSLNTTTDQLQVRSIRRIQDNRGNWQKRSKMSY
jgi:sodium pump decarboxylase gamma subunit